MITKMLGLGRNNWKMSLGNFLIIFGVQVAFKVDDYLTTLCLPSPIECAKIISNSLVITLIFYGYNRLTKKADKSCQ